MNVDTASRRGVADERLLLARYAAHPSIALEAELVTRFAPLSQSLARRYRGRSENGDDLSQVASFGLVKALRRYDPAVGKRFAAFATPTILGELRRHFRDNSWRLHMPRSIQETSLAVDRVSAELLEELGKVPTADDIAARAGIDAEDVAEALAAKISQQSFSLDIPTRSDDAESPTVLETVGREDLGYDKVESQLAVEQCAGLGEQEESVLRMRFVDELNQHEIGDRLDISQMQVSRILRRALAKLLEAVGGDERPNGVRSLEDTTPNARFPNGRTRRRRATAP